MECLSRILNRHASNGKSYFLLIWCQWSIQHHDHTTSDMHLVQQVILLLEILLQPLHNYDSIVQLVWSIPKKMFAYHSMCQALNCWKESFIRWKRFLYKFFLNRVQDLYTIHFCLVPFVWSDHWIVFREHFLKSKEKRSYFQKNKLKKNPKQKTMFSTKDDNKKEAKEPHTTKSPPHTRTLFSISFTFLSRSSGEKRRKRKFYREKRHKSDIFVFKNVNVHVNDIWQCY